ncbi:unnamed protein product [Lampetra planeri]
MIQPTQPCLPEELTNGTLSTSFKELEDNDSEARGGTTDEREGSSQATSRRQRLPKLCGPLQFEVVWANQCGRKRST